MSATSLFSTLTTTTLTTLSFATPSPTPKHGDIVDDFLNSTIPDLEPLLNNKTHSRKRGFDLVVEELIILALIICTVFASLLAKKWKISTFFGETSCAVTLGIIVGVLIMLGSHMELKGQISLDSEFFYTVILPPIIFEAGYGMSRSTFFKNFSPIMSLAFLGTAFSALVTALILWGLSQVSPFPVTFLEAFTFGSLISATDPVSVLATFNEVPVNPNLNMIIFGESAINDAVAIILYRFTTNFAVPGAQFTAGSFFLTLIAIIGVFLGSLLVGVIIAFIAAIILKHVNVRSHGNMLEVALVIIFGYSSYLVAELAYMSGIVSILFCGAAMANYTVPNMNKESQETTKSILRLLAFMTETALFIYLGLGLAAFSGEERKFEASFIFIALFAMLISRIHVFILIPICNLWKGESRISAKQMFFIWYAGLRGGVCFVLGLDLLENDDYSKEFRRCVLGAVIVISLISVLLLGGFTSTVLHKLGLDGTDPGAEFLKDVDEEGEGGEKVKIGAPKKHKLKLSRKEILDFDKRFLRPFLTKDDAAVNDGVPMQKDPSHAHHHHAGMAHSNGSEPLKSVQMVTKTGPKHEGGQILFEMREEPLLARPNGALDLGRGNFGGAGGSSGFRGGETREKFFSKQ